ncbi:MAG: hypothetical protein K8T91_04590 [Planctomycetes bacterium]|nr:hypothetical protein [Planctomycetota bacterium]
MKQVFGLLILVTVAALLAADSAALADLLPNGGGGRPRPRPRPPISEPAPQVDAGVPLTYREDAEASTSKLVIPRRYLEQAGWRKNAGGPEEADQIGQSKDHTRTIVAGVAMSLAVASVVLLRNKSLSVKVVALVVAFSVCTLGVSEILSAAPPRDKVDSQGGGGARVVIQIVEQGDSVQFVRGTR